jgi:CO/xanthine dehydrogenase Mo-binding subunit
VLVGGVAEIVPSIVSGQAAQRATPQQPYSALELEGRDVYLQGEMALRSDGKILGVRMFTESDHGAFFADAQPSKFKIGLMHSTFAAYDVPAAHLTSEGWYTNKAPGGVAYRCSFRVTEAMFFQERMMHAAANDLGMDQGEFRRVNRSREVRFHPSPLQLRSVPCEVGADRKHDPVAMPNFE